MKKSELLKLITDLQERVSRLERDNSKQYPWTINPPINQPWINVPSIWPVDLCTDGGIHEYPYLWGGTTPPPCKKCGKYSSTTTITCTTDSTSRACSRCNGGLCTCTTGKIEV